MTSVQGLVVAAVAAAAHFTFHWTVPAIVWDDSYRYAALSANLPDRFASGAWDHVSMPGYPLLLYILGHWIGTVKGIAVIQHGFGVLTCWIVWFTARRLFGARLALLAGLGLALSPSRHYYAESLLTESLGEFLLAAGVCSLVLADGSRWQRMVGLRASAGLALSLAALTRPNLLPAVFLGILAPARTSTGGGRMLWLRGMAITAIVSLALVGSWLAFNASRGVHGITGGVGLQLNIYANRFGIGTVLPDKQLSELPDSELQRIARQRIAGHPTAYVRGVAISVANLMIPIHPWGDVAPVISTCRGPELVPPLPRFDRGPPGRPQDWRCGLHAALVPAFAVLVTLSWMGLAGWGLANLLARRFTLAVVAAIPVACVGALAVMLQGNTRFAYPAETLALGFGFPALGMLCGRRRGLHSCGPAALR